MSKFVMKCPTCASARNEDVYVTVNGGLFNTGLFAKKIVQCPHGHDINVKTDRIAVKVCPHCGNNVVYDQSKGEEATCPVCKTKLNTLNDNIAAVQIRCPQCGCEHTVAKDGGTMECPICNTTIDIQREIGKINMRKENVVSLIKYEGDNNTFVWKHPIEDFKLGSQLIVHDSQEALFFCGGQALDLFKGGTYTLTTENIPLLSAIYKVPSGEQTFHSEVYFINKTVHTGIKWGTNSRIRMFDPYSGMHIALGASGKFNLAVSDSKRLILKLVGTTDIFAHSHTVDVDEEDNAKNSDKNKYRNDDTKSSDKNKARNDSSKNILDYIKSVIVTKVRTSFASVIKENGWSILEIDAHIEELSDGIKQKINPELEDYGLTMPEFFIMSISTPEDSDDPNERADYLRMKRQFGEKYLNVTEEQNKEAIALAAQKRKLIEAETAAQLKVIEAQGKAESMKLEGFAEAEVQRAQGYNVKDKMAFDVQKTFAENIGNIGGNGGSAMGDLVGLGAGLGMMSKIGKQVGNMMDMTSDNQLGSESVSEAKQSWDCSCGAKGVTGKFCNECGKPKPAPKETWDCDCGAKAQVGKFCSECGKQKPAPIEAWNCKCGAVGQTGKFCIECGEPRPTIAKTWDCACGAKNQTGKFCSECGKTRSDN